MIGIERIVIDLAKNGPATGYQIAKRSGVVRSSTYNYLKQLLEQGFVERHSVPECKGFLKKWKYSLTVLGFSYALTIIGPEERQSIMKTWSDLIPLVLGKWDIFVDAGVEDLALHRLMNAAEVLVRASQSPEWKFVLKTPIDPAQVFKSNFYYSDPLFFDHEKKLKWAKACAKDPEIRDYLIERLTMIIKSYKNKTREVEDMKHVLQGKDERKTISALDNENEDLSPKR